MYQGIYFLSIRDFKSAANNFLDSISTFTSYELMDYKTFVMYTVLASMIALERVDLRTKVGHSVHLHVHRLFLYLVEAKGVIESHFTENKVSVISPSAVHSVQCYH